MRLFYKFYIINYFYFEYNCTRSTYTTLYKNAWAKQIKFEIEWIMKSKGKNTSSSTAQKLTVNLFFSMAFFLFLFSFFFFLFSFLYKCHMASTLAFSQNKQIILFSMFATSYSSIQHLMEKTKIKQLKF